MYTSVIRNFQKYPCSKSVRII